MHRKGIVKGNPATCKLCPPVLKKCITKKERALDLLGQGCTTNGGGHLSLLYLLIHHSLGNLALNANKVDDIVLSVAQGGDEELIPEGSSVGLVVEKADGRIDALPDTLTNDINGGLVGARSLQEAAVTPEDLIEGVSGKVEEALRHVHDGIVGKTGVGDCKVLLRSRQSLHEAEIGLHEGLDRTKARRGGDGGELRRLARSNLLQQRLGPIGKLRLDDVLQRGDLPLQSMDLLLQAFQKELLPKPTALGVLSVPLPPLDLLRLGQLRLPASSGTGTAAGRRLDGGWFRNRRVRGRRGGRARRACRGNTPRGSIHGLRRCRHFLRLALGRWRRCRLPSDGEGSISGVTAGNRKVTKVAVAEELVKIESVLLVIGIVLRMVE